MNSPNKIRVISTFSGCGGSSLGYKLAGCEVLASCEIDPHAIQTYKMNFPSTRLFDTSICDLDPKKVMKELGLVKGALEIFDGSPPCQGFSTCGKRDFFDDRNQLFLDYVRFLRTLMPKAFIMENVPGMVKGNMKVTFARCLKELKDSGYKVSARVLNAAWYGVPQNRERVIFVGIRDDLKSNPSHPKPNSRPISVSTALKGLPENDKCELSGVLLDLWKKTQPGDCFSKAHPKGHYFSSRKVNPHKPSGTILKSMGSGIYHWKYPRLLTIPELKRLGSFPDEFQFPGKKDQQWARIGNSVPPLMMKAIAEHVSDLIISG